MYTHYLYDAGGNRVKKYTRTAGGNWETITYIDGIIEYRENDANEYQSISHVMDDSKRIATIREGDTFGDTTSAIKYNLDDHLGSSNVLVDENGTLVNFEEYYPFGEMRSIRERHKKTIKHVSQTSFGSYGKKRYRFCGKEKDEETRRVRERLKQKIIWSIYSEVTWSISTALGGQFIPRKGSQFIPRKGSQFHHFLH